MMTWHDLSWIALARRATALALLSQVACGGRAQYSDPAGTEASSGGTGGSRAAAGGSAGASAQPFYLDDSLPWFDSSGTIVNQFPNGGGDQTLHIVLGEVPARATLSTHNVYDGLRGMKTVEFSARASVPFQLLVSAGDSMQTYDYFAARQAGTQWPVAGVGVTVDWQNFSVPLADLRPPDTSDDGFPSFFVAFIVEYSEPIEVWLNGVYLQ